jgi:hypothetical protein
VSTADVYDAPPPHRNATRSVKGEDGQEAETSTASADAAAGPGRASGRSVRLPLVAALEHYELVTVRKLPIHRSL